MDEHPGLTEEPNAERSVARSAGCDRKVVRKGGRRASAGGKQGLPSSQKLLTSNSGSSRRKANVVLRREVKVIEGTQGRFNMGVSDATDQLVSGGSGGKCLLVQVPEGTNARSLVQRFKGARTPAQLGRYRSIRITIVDRTGAVLLDEPLVL